MELLWHKWYILLDQDLGLCCNLTNLQAAIDESLWAWKTVFLCILGSETCRLQPIGIICVHTQRQLSLPTVCWIMMIPPESCLFAVYSYFCWTCSQISHTPIPLAMLEGSCCHQCGSCTLLPHAPLFVGKDDYSPHPQAKEEEEGGTTNANTH